MAKKKRQSATPEWLVWFIISVISIAWFANATMRFTVTDYEPWVGLDPLMLAVVGFLLATKRSGDDDKGDDPPDSPPSPPVPPLPQPVAERVSLERVPTPHRRIWSTSGGTPSRLPTPEEGGD